ncbi:V-type proton ATPase subunit e 2-like [Thalassophryne amazonica]|uniref:V-type proton ATPase subunit e 2-like n=1 Tax=Thalassophryne amazonica TaxID=390379 RepID=UPI001470ADBA|nr:V-type proton ATPase subunit e 2-like [Thalassophryne amazonica]
MVDVFVLFLTIVTLVAVGFLLCVIPKGPGRGESITMVIAAALYFYVFLVIAYLTQVNPHFTPKIPPYAIWCPYQIWV